MAEKKKTSGRKFVLTDFQKDLIRKGFAALLVVFAIFVILSFVSFLFTWQADYSYLSDAGMMERSKSVANWASKIGFLWANLWVGKWLGAAALVLPAWLVACIVKLFAPGHCRLLRWTALASTGMFLLSIVLAFIGIHSGFDAILPSGWGGGCGTSVILAMENLLKPLITGLIVLWAALMWIVIARPASLDRISNFSLPAWLHKKKGDDGEEEVSPEYTEDFGGEIAMTEDMIGDNSAQDAVVEPTEEETASTEEVSQFAVENSEGGESAVEGLTIEVDREGGYDTHVTEELEQTIDYKDKMSKFEFPSLDLLGDYTNAQHIVPQSEIDTTALRIQNTLRSFRIEVTGVKAIPGPTVTLYKLQLGEGVKIAHVKNLQEDIGVALGTKTVRLVMLPDAIGVEVANAHPSIVPLKSMLADEAFRESKAELPIAIGYTISREVKTFDLTEAPHLLIAGATQQGKSVGLNVIINSLLYSKHPSELKFVFVDPKQVEFSPYASLLNHYLAVLPNPASEEELKDKAIVLTLKDAENVLKSLVVEMEDRYQLMRKAGVNKVKLYNEKYVDRRLNPEDGHKYLPYIVTVIDEYSDLTMSGSGPEGKAASRRIVDQIIRLAQKGRAAGIHIILATQRPSADVVTSLIKANFPMRIAFRVVSRGDSETILGMTGAEKLIGKGDMLLYAGAAEVQRVQCAFISNKEISDVADFIGSQTAYKQSAGPFFLPEPPEDETAGAGEGGEMRDVGKLDARFEEAARLVVEYGRASTTEVQRKMGVGYAKAARIMDQLEAHGIVGPQVGARPREVLISDFQQLQALLDVIL
ncbi:MAG: hypothetical protein J6Y32_06100 [Bacteroidales bacterium]|nr:hypothetical protein [Bacteroidales bacterium]